MASFLRTNTAVTVCVGPFLLYSDGVTPQVSLTVANCKTSLITETDDNSAPVATLYNVAGSDGTNTLAHITNDVAGYYSLKLTAANLNRVGRAKLAVQNAAAHCPVFHEYEILPAVVYDALVAGTDNFDVSVTQILGTAVSTPATAGVLDVNLKNIANAAVSTSTAQLGVNAVNVGGTAQTGRDLGASVLLSSGTGTGQLSLSAGAVLLQATQTGVTIPTVTTLTNAPTGVTLAASQHVIVDSGTVTTLTNLPAVTTDWLTGAGVKADAVTKIQSGLATPTNITAGTITTVTNLTNAATAGDFTATMKASVTTAATAATPTISSVSGSVGSVTAAVTLPSMPTDWVSAAGVSAAAVTKVQSGLATPTNITAGTITTVTNITNAPTAGDLTATMKTSMGAIVGTAQTGDSFARIGAAGAGLTALGDTRISNLDAAMSSRSTYAGADTSGTTTILGRLTSARAGYMDNLSGGAVALSSQIPSHFTNGTFVSDGVFSTAALANGPGGGGSAAAVWDFVMSGHTTGGTAGGMLAGASSAGDPWTTAIPGSYASGTAGNILGNRIDAAVSSRMATYTQPTGFLSASFPGTVASPTNITAASGVALAASQHVITDSGTITSVTNDVGITQAGADKVWASAARTLTSFGTLVADAAAAVWAAGTRTLSAFGFTVTAGTVSDKTGYSLSQSFPANFASLGISSGGKVNGVVLADTVTTYTGNTPQTGDSFARIGAAGAGLTSVGDSRIANLDAAVSSRSTYSGSDTSGTSTLLSRIPGAAALASQIPAHFTNSTFASDGVFSTASLANAPSGGGGGGGGASAAQVWGYAFSIPGSSPPDTVTAGELQYQLYIPPVVAPVVVLPAPPSDSSDCVCYLDTESLGGAHHAGIAMVFQLSAWPSLADSALETKPVTAFSDSTGRIQATLKRTDTMTPAGRVYLVTSAALGIKSKPLALATDVLNLSAWVNT